METAKLSSPFIERAPRSRTSALALAALGVVYGDIGTSPLYAIRECFFGPHGVAPSHANVLGVLSLVFWTLVVVVTLKYHVYVLRADNRGEGGILALMALIRGKVRGLGLFGAALLYADGILTPAISVLGAVEGIAVVQPALARAIVPLSIAILIALFCFQKRGTAGVGAVFGPVMLVWFASLSLLGVAGILRQPAVLAAAAARASSCSAPCSWSRPAGRPSMPTSATSVSGPSRSTGSGWSGSRSCSTTSGRGR
jgi:KUP system potassium uptake protein